ncbi:MAG: UPF0280 family protein [Acidobacteria bacterium]|nr:UPF0280 family protein [Acidobacteriota bacterium]MBV9622652.1 UPF0280 family protein [Acidobacteriota bacterium]
MREPPLARPLPDGRLHLHDGPIDLILEAFGERHEIRAGYYSAAKRFANILDELCEELPLLRSAARRDGPQPSGRVARRMASAVEPFAESVFITPMAAVAGAVAEEILEAMIMSANLERAYVNNGGDIAFHLAPAESFIVGMVERPDRPSLFGTLRIDGSRPERGIATSGWRGRSFSLGIADAVTVLATCASKADAAATVVANAVDLPGHRAILRVPARELAPDSDLGDRPVTRNVGRLDASEIEQALDAGLAVALEIIHESLISTAALNLSGVTRVAGPAFTSGNLRAMGTSLLGSAESA